MKQFELQKPISQLFNALKSHIFLHVKSFQIGCSKQSNKTHNFRKIIFVTLELLWPPGHSLINYTVKCTPSLVHSILSCNYINNEN